MFKKGHRRESKGLAVLYFIIGLLVLLIILAIIYFALVKLDYSDQIIDPNAPIRSYVAPTATLLPVEEEPTATSIEDVPADELEGDDGDASDAEGLSFSEPEDDISADEFDVGADQDTSEDEALPELEEDISLNEYGFGDEMDDSAADTDASDEPGEDAEPAEEATEEPTPEPTATPAPTKVPASKINRFTTKSLKLPDISDNGVVGITQCELPEANEGSVMYLAGFGYADDPKFNGKYAKSYMVITRRSNGKSIIYELTMKDGVSGESHEDAKCANASACDYELFIDVSKYADDIYSMSLVIQYTAAGSKNPGVQYPFEDLSFTVLDGRIETPVLIEN